MPLKTRPWIRLVLKKCPVSSVPWHTQILADQLTLFQPGWTDYAHLITIGTPGFLDLPTALQAQRPPRPIKKLPRDVILI